MENHSVEWDRRKANRLAVKAPRNRSRHERTTDCCRGLKHVVLEVESIDRMYLNVYVPELQAVEGALKFIRIHRGHKVASTHMVEPITREFVGSIERSPRTTGFP